MNKLSFLLKLEWHKFRKYTFLKVLAIAYALALPGIMLIGKKLPDLPPPLVSNQQLFEFPHIWGFLGYIGNWLTFFLIGFLGIVCVTLEFSNKTLRQNIITGMSRTDFFLGKLAFLTVIGLIATAYFALCGFVFGFTHSAFPDVQLVFEKTGIIPRYFLMCMGYGIFGLMIGTLFRRSGLAIMLYFSYVMFIELILRWLVHLNIIQHKSMHFYPMNAIEDLAPVPFADVAEQFSEKQGFSFFLTPTEAVITTLVYLGIFLFLTYRLLTKRDL